MKIDNKTNERDCPNCKHHTDNGCSSWNCEFEPTTKNNIAVDYTINSLDDFIEFGKKAFGVELTIKKSDNPDTYEKLFGNFGELDCISRADAIRVASGYCHPSNVTKELAKLPSVTPQLRKGHWISTETKGVRYAFWCRYKCSLCGELSDYKNFCPNCGAKMESEDKE